MKRKPAHELTDAEALRRLFPKPVRDAMRRAAAKNARKSGKDKRKAHGR